MKEPRISRRRTTVIAASATVLVVAALCGGAYTVIDAISGSFRIGHEAAAPATATKAPTPAPTVVPVGGVLDEETALELRREMPDSGDYAYRLPDGRWIKINTVQPLPADVVATEQQKVSMSLPSTGTTIEAAVTRAKGTTSAAGSSQFATGKLTLVISLQAQGNGDGSGNRLVYKVLGAVQPGSELARANEAGGWSDPDEALTAVQAIVSQSPDAAKYQIILVR